MSEGIERLIGRINNHAWGTPSNNSPNILSDALLQLERGVAVDLESLRTELLDDLQLVNVALRTQNTDDVQPESVSMKLTYAASKINVLLLNSAMESRQPYSSQLVAFARDFAEAWYCLLSCDIEDVREGF
jgi:hypothetical protein